eukprot:2889217-Amphidinium_carterae.1
MDNEISQRQALTPHHVNVSCAVCDGMQSLHFKPFQHALLLGASGASTKTLWDKSQRAFVLREVMKEGALCACLRIKVIHFKCLLELLSSTLIVESYEVETRMAVKS